MVDTLPLFLDYRKAGRMKKLTECWLGRTAGTKERDRERSTVVSGGSLRPFNWSRERYCMKC